MELPRISRVGHSLREHGRLAMCVAIVMPLGALATKILRSQHAAKEATARKVISEAAIDLQDFGEGWQILGPEDFEDSLVA